MIGRIIATIVLILILTLIFLAPQGLLTKPMLEERNAGPYRLRDMETVTPVEAINRVVDLAFEDSLLQAGWLPCVINERLVSGAETVRIGLIAEDHSLEIPDTTNMEISAIIWPEGQYLVASFPYRGLYSLKLGSGKVYRGFLHETMKRNLIPSVVLEIFDVDAEEIRYLMPVEQRPATIQHD